MSSHAVFNYLTHAQGVSWRIHCGLPEGSFLILYVRMKLFILFKIIINIFFFQQQYIVVEKSRETRVVKEQGRCQV